MSNKIGIGIDVFGAGIDADATTIYNRIIADGGVSNLSRLNFFVKGLKAIYGDLANVPVCYDAHWIGYKLGSGTGATAGQAAAKLYSLTVAGDAVQATAASQPLLLSHNGASSDNYWYGSGVSGNNVSTPNATANRIVGDIEIIVNISPVTWTPSNNNVIVSKDAGTGSNRSYSLILRPSGAINYQTSLTGSDQLVYSSTAVISGTLNRWIKINRIASTGVCKFFTSNDGITYTQLGSDVAGTSGNTFNGTSPVMIGQENSYTLELFQGKIYRATIANSIGGTPVVDFNPATYNAATSQTAWTSATGEVWTISTGTATSGYKGQLVSRTIVQGDGVDDKMTASGFSAITLNTRFAALNPINISGGYIIQGRQSGTGDKHLWYQTGGNIQAYTNAGGSINFAGIAANSLKLYSTDFNTTSSNCLTNNVNQVNGTLNSDSFTDLDIFGGGTFKNCVINTLIETSSVSSATVRTATYNLIRSLNNNAF